MRTSTRTVAAALALVAIAIPTTVHADSPPTLSEPIAEGLAGPLQLTVQGDTVYVGQAFAGLLTKIDKNGATENLAVNPGGEIAGSALDGQTVVYTTRNGPPTGRPDSSTLSRVRRGTTSVVADLLAYEVENNPDGGVEYGFDGISDECAAQLPPEVGPPTYTGLVDSHAYGVAEGAHKWYIADAGGNDILAVSSKGVVSTVAVLPPQPLVITAETAATVGFPECTVGLTYNFEAVPTDVEVSNSGILYVTTLPGGPEDPSLGARGSVYAVDPSNGDVALVAGGFLGATNLAIGKRGAIYVAELFGGRVSQIVDGVPQTVVELPQPAGLEWANGKLYVSYDVFGPSGKVATISV
ncbi:MAG TPA: ScyD/ScyE family protein [Ilumatobacteraceae bacterium]|nr:ScyD/ScyE family protein [Ilumatobacteraceae bacterium]